MQASQAPHADILTAPGLAPILAALPQARLVGGCVRDSLIHHPVADIDLATPDLPDAILAALEHGGIRAIPTGLSHGTVTAVVDGQPFEITTLRRDRETDGRHALVEWTGDFAEDAARRDFTINAMSIDQTGRLHDYFGGRTDLAAGRVRFVGEAALRVAEDHLRILRFFRFFARYGAAAPDAQAIAAIEAARDNLRQLSAERVWSEIKRVLAVPEPGMALALMDGLGVLRVALPEAALTDVLRALLASEAPADPLLRLAAMLTGDADRLASRLRLSGGERQRLAALTSGVSPAPGDDDAAIRRHLADADRETLIGRTWLAFPDDAALRARLAAVPRPVFPLEGRHGLALGLAPGPPLGQALREVRGWWLAGGCTATREECEAQLLAFAGAA